MTIFLDIAPVAGGIGIFAGIAFFLVLAAFAFVAFKMLKKTVKMAFRMLIVAVILVIAIAGSVSFFWLGNGKTSRPERPRPSQQR